MKLYRVKIRTKAQVDLSLATAIKDNEKCFYKYLSNKRKAKKNHYPLLNVGGSVKVRGRLRYFMKSLSWSLMVRPVMRVPSSLSWKTGIRSRMRHLNARKNSQ